MRKQVISMDKFLTQTLRAFLDAQFDMYFEEMDRDSPQVGNGSTIQACQARYEVAYLAAATVARFACMTSQDGTIPRKYRDAMETFQRMICEAGDDWLRAQRIDPDTF